jgi:hypothetical protein
MKSIRWWCLCIKEPRVLLAMLPLTLGLAAVDAQLAACERAMVGLGWQKEDARHIALWRRNMDFAKRRIAAGGVAGGYCIATPGATCLHSGT